MRTELLALTIPIVGIVMGIGIAMLAIYLNYRKRRETFALYHQERMAALEKGVDLPPLPDYLLTDDNRPIRPYHPRLHLLKGLTWLFIGIGVGLGIWATADWEPALFSLILVGIGLAHLIYYFVEGKREAAGADLNRGGAAARA
jgi:hypothetical protein